MRKIKCSFCEFIGNDIYSLENHANLFHVAEVFKIKQKTRLNYEEKIRKYHLEEAEARIIGI